MQTKQTQVQKSTKQTQVQKSTKQIKLHKPGNKPSSGHTLYAYTWATMSVLGMLNGAAGNVKAFRFLNGSRILSHHADKFEVSGSSIKCVLPSYFHPIGEKALNVQRAATSAELGQAFAKYIRDGQPMKDYPAGKPQVGSFTI